jgi:hypothetical protein
VEEYARDSFENLAFSVCRFREIVGELQKPKEPPRSVGATLLDETGAYPKFITVVIGAASFFAGDSYESSLDRRPDVRQVGFEFKRRRFVDLHAAAIGWPRGALEYEGSKSDVPASRRR